MTVGTLPHGYAKSVPLPQLTPDHSPVPRTYIQAQGHPSVADVSHQRTRAPITRNPAKPLDAPRAIASLIV